MHDALIRKYDLASVTEKTKGVFFSESAIRFSNLQISKKKIPKNYPELEI